MGIRKILEEQLFPFVIKPGRYVGGEPGQIIKDHENRLKYVHAFPDKYEIGQSYLGLQTLYNITNKDDRFLCERVFAVDNDAEKIMRQNKIPLFSLESATPINEFDAIGFTLSYEMVYTNMLNMLDMAGIPIKSKDRNDSHPIVFAGGPAVYNPEPIADFVDCFFIGDAEEGLIELLNILHENKDLSRTEKLEAICKKIESVYIPRFYDNNRQPINDFAPADIKARVIKELKPEYYPDNPIVPLIEIVQGHLSIEIMRGCPQGCRFCQAGPMYKPVRFRPIDDILKQVEVQVGNTGHDSISLLSLSTSDYPEIEKLASTLARRLEKQKISISVPSLRPGTISPKLLDAVKKVRKAGLTIAPEAGTERMRQFIRKDVTDTAIFDTADMAFRKGWTSIKLYFIIGLPTETDDDLQGVVDIINKVYEIGRKYPGKKTVNVTLSPFVAEPHTPFQWDAILNVDEILGKLKFIKRSIKNRHVNFKHTNCESSILQAILGRGGRELAPVIESVFNQGARFDSWSEDFKPDLWFEALKENDLEVSDYLKAIPFSADLPWSHIRKGPSVEHLHKERERTSTQMQKYVPFENDGENGDSYVGKMEFGRNKKKVPSQNVAAPTKNRIRMRWGRGYKYKYMSHLDNLRTLEKAFRRSGVPIAYSQGFNPNMKLSFGPPLSLGITSEAEYMDIVLDTNVMPYMIENIRKEIPDGMKIYEIRNVIGKAVSLTARLNRAVYNLKLDKEASSADLINKIKGVLDKEILEIERVGKNKTTVINIRPAIYELLIDENNLKMTLGLGDGGYVRPTEVLELLFEKDKVKVLADRLHRTEFYHVDENGNRIDPMDL